MSSILITVGAQADASFTRVFAPLQASSGRARVQVSNDAAAAARAQEREYKKAAKEAERAFKSIEAASAKAAAKETADAQRAAQAKVKAEQRAFDERLKAVQRAQLANAKATEKAKNDELRANERAAAQKRAIEARFAAQAERDAQRRANAEQQSRERLRQAETRAQRREFDQRLRESKRAKEREEREILRTARQAEAREEREAAQATRSRAERIKDVARNSMRNMAAVGGAAMDIGRAGFRAAGVNFDAGTLMQRGIDLQSIATATTISAASGKGKRATAADVSGTVDAIKSAGHASSQNYGALAQGLSDFVSKSADLETGKLALADLGNIARATGADVNELVSAAGDVSKTIGNVGDGERFATAEEKAKSLLAIMRLVAKQGAMGSVEIKDLARYMGNITASSFMFEGGIDSNIGILGGLAQVSMKGGATTAADATRAANSFSRDITKGAALKRFEDAGINVFANSERTKLVSPEKVITQFLEKTGGSLDELAELFQNDMSRKVIKGYSQIYDEAGGGAAGIQAVKNEFKRFSTSMTEDDVKAAADLSKGGTAAKAQEFQNKLEDLGMQLADKLLPALMKLTPTILKLADAFVSITTWAAENPGKAIVAAIVASIGKAMIGSAITSSLTSMATSLAGAGAGAGAGALGAGASAAGAGAAGAAGLGAAGAGLAAGAAGFAAVAGIGLAAWQAHELYKNARVEGSGDTFWKELKHDLGLMSDKDYENSFGIRTGANYLGGAGAPPTSGQPAGAPPTVTAPQPNPVPTLQDIAAQSKAQTAALQDIAKNTAAQASAGPGINNAARTGPGKK